MSQIVEDIGVTRSTVTRDFEYLRDFLGAPIVYDREANGHHYDPQAEAFELPGFWLNQSELYALLATQQPWLDHESSGCVRQQQHMHAERCRQGCTLHAGLCMLLIDWLMCMRGACGWPLRRRPVAVDAACAPTRQWMVDIILTPRQPRKHE